MAKTPTKRPASKRVSMSPAAKAKLEAAKKVMK